MITLESPLERQSTRLNRVEQKRLEKQLKLLTNNQRTVALDIQKSQREMKRRLQEYRERQRDLLGTTLSGPAMTIEEILQKHQPRLTSETPARRPRRSRRPASAPPPKIDMSAFLDIQKSKVDLRPTTAAPRRREMLRRLDSQVLSAPHGSYRPFTGERLGTADMEARYFVNEELNERSAFYRDLTEWRKRNERAYYRKVKGRVFDFCGLEAKENKSGLTAKWRSVGVVMRFKKVVADTNASNAAPPTPEVDRFGRRRPVPAPREAWSSAGSKRSSRATTPGRVPSRADSSDSD